MAPGAAAIIRVFALQQGFAMKAADFAPQFAEAPAPDGDTLALPGWGLSDWRKLLEGTTPQPFKSGEVVIQRDATDRALFFVAAGTVEVGVMMIDGLSVASLAHIG